MSNVNPIAPLLSAVAHTNLIHLFEVVPIGQKVISAPASFGSSQSTLVNLKRN